MGFKVIVVVMSVVGGRELFLTFWIVTGRVSGRSSCLEKKTRSVEVKTRPKKKKINNYAKFKIFPRNYSARVRRVTKPQLDIEKYHSHCNTL